VRADDVLDVQAGLDRLDRRHREVLVLLFVEGLTIDEIARVVGAPPGTVKSRIHYAKRALGALLEGPHHE
jgi:RNA polymerase sigma-70 factor, ECF subfamily